jgi:plastocyanin
MYKLTVTLFLLLAGSLCYGANTNTIPLQLTDSLSGKPVANAVVLLENGPAESPIEAEIVQKNRNFHPHTLIIPKNSRVDFPNQDNTQHHVYSFSPAKTFNIELYAGRPTEPVVFNKTGVVEIGCNIHDHMQAFILITDSAPSGRTDERGRLTVEIPPSADSDSGKEAGLLVWHPRLTDNTRMARFTIELPHSGPLELSVELSPEPASNDRLDGLQNRFREL